MFRPQNGQNGFWPGQIKIKMFSVCLNYFLTFFKNHSTLFMKLNIQYMHMHCTLCTSLYYLYNVYLRSRIILNFWYIFKKWHIRQWVTFESSKNILLYCKTFWCFRSFVPKIHKFLKSRKHLIKWNYFLPYNKLDHDGYQIIRNLGWFW